MWYAQNGGRAAQLYLTSLLKMIHDEKGFGAGRLGKLFDPVAAEVRWYVEKFFLGTEAGDREIKKKIDAVHERIAECGVELVQIPASDAVAVRKIEKKPEKTTPKPTDAERERYEALLRETVGRRTF